MKRLQVTEERVQELLSRFRSARIAVLGDFFLDKYLDVNPALAEPSVETGKVAHQVVDVRCSPGAAGTVVCNLAALGAGTLHAVGFTGDDGEGFDLRKQLKRLGCCQDHLHIDTERHTPTYLKPRDQNVESLAAEHSRYDTKNHQPLGDETQRRVLESLDQILPNVDAVIVLDQVEQTNCGLVTDHVRNEVSTRAKDASAVFWADSRRRIEQFRHVIIKPNQFEVMGIENPEPEQQLEWEAVETRALDLRRSNEAPVVITRARDGMIVSDPDWTTVPAVPVAGPIDPTGAGDSATAGSVLALCAGATLPEAALIGNLVASITIQQINTTGTATVQEVERQFRRWNASSVNDR